LALVRKIPRQATVVAKTDAIVVYLDKDTFNRLMGPIEGILKRNEDRYSKYWNAEDSEKKEWFYKYKCFVICIYYYVL